METTGKKILGIELGSTRIKSVLIDENARVLAKGSHSWENRLENGLWTYSVADMEKGIASSFASLQSDYRAQTGESLTRLDALGVSALMHGYIALDEKDNFLVPFRTWRNTNTARASEVLTEKLGFNIPMRWSVSHFAEAVMGREKHVGNVSFLTTLAGYVHYRLTGEKALGIGDASGMFPVSGNGYNKTMLDKADRLLVGYGMKTPLVSLLPKPLTAGESAGVLTKRGALLLDPTGELEPGACVCPPEGDAGTGMVATNSIRSRTANVSAGTSAFLMTVLEKPLDAVHREIDVVATPHGLPVAMVHVNNCTNEINAWAGLFMQLLETFGVKNVTHGELLSALFNAGAKMSDDVGGLVGYNFLSGEPTLGLESGRPIVIREPGKELLLSDFMGMQIYGALGALALGAEILAKEGVKIDEVCAHGGFFKTAGVGDKAMSAALGAPVSVMKNAGEGGAFGMALLALFARCGGGSLEEFTDGVFEGAEKTVARANEREKCRFAAYLERYKAALGVARAAAKYN